LSIFVEILLRDFITLTNKKNHQKFDGSYLIKKRVGEVKEHNRTGFCPLVLFYYEAAG
jgi:hypothetical protein